MAQKRATQKRTGGNSKRLRLYGAVLGVGVLLSGGAIFAGQADEGFINVTQVMQNSNDARAEAEANGSVAGESRSTPVNTRPSVPNGGLVGTGKPAPQPEPEPDVNGTSTNATSSDTAADAGSEDGEAEADGEAMSESDAETATSSESEGAE